MIQLVGVKCHGKYIAEDSLPCNVVLSHLQNKVSSAINNSVRNTTDMQ